MDTKLRYSTWSIKRMTQFKDKATNVAQIIST
ncbi:hypothetical protein OTSUT76_1757 [Orientia tsutsugamushi str. UT76]|nr:hypothetical protein OTSUT76_1757 [Orientia tsutsugamushi str. UT76]